MPQFNGPLSFLVEVLGHLAWNYLAWIFVLVILLPAPFVVWAVVAVGLEEAFHTWPPITLASRKDTRPCVTC